MYVCQPQVPLLVVGLIASLVGIVLLANFGGVSERAAGLFGRYGLPGRFADRPDAWRVLGVITLGWSNAALDLGGRSVLTGARDQAVRQCQSSDEPFE